MSIVDLLAPGTDTALTRETPVKVPGPVCTAEMIGYTPIEGLPSPWGGNTIHLHNGRHIAVAGHQGDDPRTARVIAASDSHARAVTMVREAISPPAYGDDA